MAPGISAATPARWRGRGARDLAAASDLGGDGGDTWPGDRKGAHGRWVGGGGAQVSTATASGSSERERYMKDKNVILLFP